MVLDSTLFLLQGSATKGNFSLFGLHLVTYIISGSFVPEVISVQLDYMELYMLLLSTIALHAFICHVIIFFFIQMLMY